MTTTHLIRAAATLVWLGLALANHARADVRITDGRLSLRTEHLPLGALIARLERSGLAGIEVHGDASGITVSDSFEGADVAQTLRRVLSAQSHVLIDRGPHDEGPRIIELILLSSPADGRSGAGPAPEQLANAALPSASPAERASAAEAVAADALAQLPTDAPGAEGRVQAIELRAERAGRKAGVRLRRARR
jgi:hypothetical protein